MAVEIRGKSNWTMTESRFVAFLDILGFKDTVMRNSHDDIYDKLSTIEKYSKQIQSIEMGKKNPKYNNCEVYVVNFSDSIVIFSKDDSVVNFQFFLNTVGYLFLKCILSNIPLKGAISHGITSVNKSKQIYFGQSIIDAYLLEEELNYMGIILHNSVDTYIAKNATVIYSNTNTISQFFHEFRTPLKNGKYLHKNLDWKKMLWAATGTDNLHEAQEKVKAFYNSCSGNTRKYIDNTLEVLELSFNKQNQ